MSQMTDKTTILRSQSSHSLAKPYQGEAFKAAIIQGHYIEIDKFLAKGIDTNEQFTDGSLPLNIAIQKADIPIIVRLLKASAQINISDKFNQTPLSLAIAQQNTQIIDFLLQNGADPNFAAAGQQKPIIIAIHKKDDKTVQKLINCGAYEARDDDCVFIFATLYGTPEILNTLTKHPDLFDINKKNKNEETALYIAADRALDKQVTILLAAKANPKTPDRFSQTPATANSRQIFPYDGHSQSKQTGTFASNNIISYRNLENLVEFQKFSERFWGGQIDLDQKTQRIQAPSRLEINRKLIEAEVEEYFNIFEAIHFGRYDRIKELTENMANFAVTNADGDTPLIYAIRQQKTQIVELLLNAGADPNTQNELELTPLIIAINENNPAIVKLLLNAGANPRLTGYQDINPLFVATMQNKPEMIKILFCYLELTQSDINELNELANNASQNNNEAICDILDMKIIELTRPEILEVRAIQ